MASTYEPIATTTLGSTAASITLSSIPNTYTDLKIVVIGSGTSAGSNPNFRLNGDSGTNYSQTNLAQTNNVAYSTTFANLNVLYLLDQGTNPPSTSTMQFYTVDIFSYASSIYKTCLITESMDANGNTQSLVGINVGMYRSTSAINSITIQSGGGTWAAGTSVTIYGILKA